VRQGLADHDRGTSHRRPGKVGVAGLLPRRRGTGEGREARSVAAFDNRDDGPVIGGGSDDVLRHRGGEGSEVRPREEDRDD
jgi:hypothetical protein